MPKPEWGKKQVSPNAKLLASVEKKPFTTAPDPEGMDRKPSWRTARLVTEGDFGWHKIDASMLRYVLGKLAHFESMTWGEISAAKKQHHYITWDALSPEGRAVLETACRDEERETLFSFRLSGTERVYGLRLEGVLSLLVWDPEHKVCLSELKNT